MSRRLPCPEEHRGGSVEISLEGAPIRAFEAESIAAALMIAAHRPLSRSLKYHRPRGFFCLDGHCGGCLMRIDGVPNLRACLTPCRPGAQVESQNAYPSAETDLLGAVDFLFPRGMDHHTLMTSSSILNHLASKVVRQMSGLGKIPSQPATQSPPSRTLRVDVAVIGGGPAGLAAATAAARTGATTVLVDDQLRLGGSLLTDPRHGLAEATRRAAEAKLAGVSALTQSTAIAYFPEDDGGLLAVATPTQLVRVHARRWVWATGGYAVNMLFPDNDRPGILAARAVGRLLLQHSIVAGERVCMIRGAGMEDYASAVTRALRDSGVEVVEVAEDDVERARGRGWVTSIELKRGSPRRVDCDLVAIAARPAPASEGPRQHGCAVLLEPEAGGFRVIVDGEGRTSVAGVFACGDVTGYAGPDAAAAMGARIGALASAEVHATAQTGAG